MRKLIFGILFMCSICMDAQTYSYDINGDGKVDIDDVTYLTNHILGIYNKGEHGPVDLGLPSGTKWANCNLGADSPEDYGQYFAWGDIVGYASSEAHTFSSSNYVWYDSTNKVYTKYVTSSSYGTIDDKVTLDDDDDAAHVLWGGTWRMPTYDEIEELFKNCSMKWTKMNDINGYELTGKNGNSIFLPAAGFRSSNTISSVGSYTCYWSSGLFDSEEGADNSYAWCLYNDGLSFYETGKRYRGLCIRPVCP